mmetsp:Transcript_39017/g.93596  ORF Transcript_39017/g.93596 Transcript_39017/m.93596 type:complete len:207 (-) Transcript_39017:312-932(-)
MAPKPFAEGATVHVGLLTSRPRSISIKSVDCIHSCSRCAHNSAVMIAPLCLHTPHAKQALASGLRSVTLKRTRDGPSSSKPPQLRILACVTVSLGSMYSCQEFRLQKGLPELSLVHFLCKDMTVRMAVLMSVISGTPLSTAVLRSSKPSVRACESIESGTLMTRSSFPARSRDSVLGSRFTKGLYTTTTESIPPCIFMASAVFFVA